MNEKYFGDKRDVFKWTLVSKLIKNPGCSRFEKCIYVPMSTSITEKTQVFEDNEIRARLRPCDWKPLENYFGGKLEMFDWTRKYSHKEAGSYWDKVFEKHERDFKGKNLIFGLFRVCCA